MSLPDTSAWTTLGQTTTATRCIVEPRLLCAIALPGARGTGPTARENVELQLAYFREAGPGAVIYFIDPAVDQTAEARRVYREETDPTLVRAVAIVASSLLGRAIASFCVTLRPPQMPFKSTSSYEEARAWLRAIL